MESELIQSAACWLAGGGCLQMKVGLEFTFTSGEFIRSRWREALGTLRCLTEIYRIVVDGLPQG